MYNIEFYEKTDGSSDVWDFLEQLRACKDTNKDARIQFKQAKRERDDYLSRKENRET